MGRATLVCSIGRCSRRSFSGDKGEIGGFSFGVNDVHEHAHHEVYFRGLLGSVDDEINGVSALQA